MSLQAHKQRSTSVRAQRTSRQYREQPPLGPVLAIDVARWSSWSTPPADLRLDD
jgi:hypothetical protein